MLACLVGLVRSGDRVSFVDERGERAYRDLAAVYDTGASAPKTDAGQPPVAVTVRVRDTRRRALVHLFDAAGEALADPDQNARLAYLDYARTLAFVLDPFAVPDVRDQYARSYADLFRAANAASEDPEASYQAVVTRLREYGVPTDRKRLAFVLSKQDLLGQLPIADRLRPDHAAVRAWLLDRGLDNLVISAERDFREVRFFLVTAAPGADPGQALAPLRWLLAAERVPLPVNGGPS